MAYNNIVLEKNNGITKMTIDRPPVNVMDQETIEEMCAALEELAKDDETKVLLIRGAGEKAFCAGVEVGDHVGEKMPVMMETFGKLFKLIRNLGKPSIAVVNGIALGGGCELIIGCDLAVASEKAKMGQPEIVLGGLAPVAAPLLPRIMGEKKAFEIMLLGGNMSAVDAERFGLVNKVVPPEELDAAAEEMAGKFLSMTPLGVKLVRDAFYKTAEIPDFNAAIDKGVELGIESWNTHDGQEGLKAYLEKRSPEWKNE
ncbi:MAG: enoyl-CoA hydratase/isomerase family protein [Dehalococcoidales bacterium]|nr:enoyl-CoA hydratase/isomerase family protein [Dehalococcoidales bacterium]